MQTLLNWARRRQTPLFFVLSLALTWVAFIPFYASGGESIPWFTFGPASPRSELKQASSSNRSPRKQPSVGRGVSRTVIAAALSSNIQLGI